MADLITEIGNDPSNPMSPLAPTGGSDHDKAPDELVRGLEEINLLGGIASGGQSRAGCTHL